MAAEKVTVTKPVWSIVKRLSEVFKTHNSVSSRNDITE
jgi:hypothetical protein